MNKDCEFLEAIEERGRVMPCCGIGVNFYFVGDNRELCNICSVPVVQHLPDCQYLEPFAVLCAAPGGVRSIEPEFICTLEDLALRDLSKCARCPAYEGDTGSNPAFQPQRDEE